MEEDIKILEEFITNWKDSKRPIFNVYHVCALENLLTRYKQMEAENKKYLIKLTDEGYRKVIQEAQDDVMGNIKELRKRNSEMITKIKQLEEENKELREEECCMTTCLRKDREKLFFENKIKEKLKELDSKSGGNTYHVQAMINAQKNILKWVLEEE